MDRKGIGRVRSTSKPLRLLAFTDHRRAVPQTAMLVVGLTQSKEFNRFLIDVHLVKTIYFRPAVL